MAVKSRITETEIISAERQRVVILESPEGLRNPEAARKMVNTGMLPDQARELLAGLPPASPYLAALDREAAISISPHHSGDVFGADPKEKRLKELRDKNAAGHAAGKQEQGTPLGDDRKSIRNVIAKLLPNKHLCFLTMNRKHILPFLKYFLEKIVILRIRRALGERFHFHSISS